MEMTALSTFLISSTPAPLFQGPRQGEPKQSLSEAKGHLRNVSALVENSFLAEGPSISGLPAECLPLLTPDLTYSVEVWRGGGGGGGTLRHALSRKIWLSSSSVIYLTGGPSPPCTSAASSVKSPGSLRCGSNQVFVESMTDVQRALLVIKHSKKLIFMMTWKKRTARGKGCTQNNVS